MLPTTYVPAHSVLSALSGDPEAPAVVIGSSIGATSAMWSREISALRAAHRVITYEHPGHGATVARVPASEPAPPGPYTVDELAAAVLRLLDSLDVSSAHVVGLSLGGAIAQSLALQAPSRVSSIAVVCSAATFPPPSMWRGRAAAVRAAGTVAVPSIVDTLPDRWLSAAFRAAFLDVAAGLAAGLSTVDVEGYAGCCEALAGWDVSTRLGEIAVPALIVAGIHDLATPVAAAEFLRDGIRGSRLEVVDSSHLAPVEVDLSALLIAHLAAVG